MHRAPADIAQRLPLLQVFLTTMSDIARRMAPAERHALAADVARQAMEAEEAGQSAVEAALIELHASLTDRGHDRDEPSTFAGAHAREVSTSHLRAFGMELRSSNARAGELAELLRFAEAAAEAGVAELMVQAYYDSDTQTCSFEFARALTLGEPVERRLLAAARATISRFEWLDRLYQPLGWAQDSTFG